MADEEFVSPDEGIEDVSEPIGDVADNVQTLGTPPAEPREKPKAPEPPPAPAPQEKDGWLKRLGKHLLGRDPDEIEDPDQVFADVAELRRRAEEHRAVEEQIRSQQEQERIAQQYSEYERQMAKMYADIYGNSEDPFLAMARSNQITQRQMAQQMDQLIEAKLAAHRAREDAVTQFQGRHPELAGATSMLEAMGQLVEAASGYQLTPEQRIQVGERIASQLMEKTGAEVPKPRPRAVRSPQEGWGPDVLEGTVGSTPSRSAEDVKKEHDALIAGALKDMFG